MDSNSEIKNISYVYDAKNSIPSYEVGYSIIQDAILEIRAKKWTLSKIASLLGTSQSNLSRLLKRPIQIKKETLSRYMDVLVPHLD